jgi:hypothetical protein
LHVCRGVTGKDAHLPEENISSRDLEMIGDTYPKFRAGVVHASPVFLDREATIDKLGKIANKAKE